MTRIHVDNMVAPEFRDIRPFTPGSQAGHALRYFVSRREGAVAYCLDAAAYCRREARGQARRGYLQFARYWTDAARTMRQAVQS